MDEYTLKKAKSESAKKPGQYVVVVRYLKYARNKHMVLGFSDRKTAVWHYRQWEKRGLLPVLAQDKKIIMKAA